MVLLISGGCDQPPTTNPQVGRQATEVVERSDRIGDSAKRIDDLAASGEVEWPEAQQWRPIRTEATAIHGESVELQRLATQLRAADKAVQRIEAERDAALATVERVKKEGSRKHFLWMSMLGAAAISAGVGILFVTQFRGWPAGMAAIAGGGTVIALASFMQTHTLLLNVFGGVVLFGSIGWTVWVAYRNHEATDRLIDDIDQRIKPLLPAGLWDQIRTSLKGEQPDALQRRVAERKADRLVEDAKVAATAKLDAAP